MAHIIRFEDGAGSVRYGVERGNEVFPINGELFGDYQVAPAAVTMARRLAPLEPVNIFAIGLNYRGHATEQGLTDDQLPMNPMIFMKASTAVIAAGERIELPAAAPEMVDYEAELAIVIGRRCRRAPVEKALDYVFGYTCANDVSARDCQRADKQYVRAKSFDTFCPLGPVIATADSLNPADVSIRSVLNGTQMQNGRTSELLFDVPTLISFMSHQFTLLPGTVILTGTPAGVGFARKPPVFLKNGDVIRIEIDGIGALENPVTQAP